MLIDRYEAIAQMLKELDCHEFTHGLGQLLNRLKASEGLRDTYKWHYQQMVNKYGQASDAPLIADDGT